MDAGLVIIVAAESLLWASAAALGAFAAVAIAGVVLFRPTLDTALVTTEKATSSGTSRTARERRTSGSPTVDPWGMRWGPVPPCPLAA
jgi:membrane protein implicated in regulation of membrane protease activity